MMVERRKPVDGVSEDSMAAFRFVRMVSLLFEIRHMGENCVQYANPIWVDPHGMQCVGDRSIKVCLASCGDN